MKIRPMEEKDLTELALIEQACFARPWTKEMLAEELKNEYACFLVGEEKGKVIGYAGCHMLCGEGYIANIAIAPAFRRRGTGCRLVLALLAEGQRRKLDFISLEVRESNEPARRLYALCGFQKAGRRKGFYSNPTEDGIIMTYQVKA